jgi:hypothetical protein
MRIHVGCELRFEFPQTAPMIATLNVHFSRVSELERPDYLITNPSVPLKATATASEIGAVASLRPPGISASARTPLFVTRACRTRSIWTLCSTKFSTCRRKLYCFCLAVVTVRPIVYPTRLGACSEARRLVRAGPRRRGRASNPYLWPRSRHGFIASMMSTNSKISLFRRGAVQPRLNCTSRAMASDILKYWRFSRLRVSAHLVETPLPLFGRRYETSQYIVLVANVATDAAGAPRTDWKDRTDAALASDFRRLSLAKLFPPPRTGRKDRTPPICPSVLSVRG